jgi:hypothetical protein
MHRRYPSRLIFYEDDCHKQDLEQIHKCWQWKSDEVTVDLKLINNHIKILRFPALETHETNVNNNWATKSTRENISTSATENLYN